MAKSTEPMENPSIQERFAPQSICFGCGPANPQGLRIRSFPEDGQVVATFVPQAHHQAFPGVLNGGIIGALLDCHGNWTAAYTLMLQQNLPEPPVTVTAEFSIALKRPCPAGVPLQLRARAVKVEGDRVQVEGELEADGKVRATLKGLFVAVTPGHPAYHRW